MSRTLQTLNTITPSKTKRPLKIAFPSWKYISKRLAPNEQTLVIASVEDQYKFNYLSISTDIRFITSGDSSWSSFVFTFLLLLSSSFNIEFSNSSFSDVFFPTSTCALSSLVKIKYSNIAWVLALHFEPIQSYWVLTIFFIPNIKITPIRRMVISIFNSNYPVYSFRMLVIKSKSIMPPKLIADYPTENKAPFNNPPPARWIYAEKKSTLFGSLNLEGWERLKDSRYFMVWFTEVDDVV